MPDIVYAVNPTRRCWCGGYGIADCTQCENALCIRHAHNPHPRSTEGTNLLDFDYLEACDPQIYGIAVKISLIVNDQVLDSYKGKNICASCHAINVREAHANAVKDFVIPEGRFDFLLFILLSLPTQYKLATVEHPAFIPPETVGNFLGFTIEEIAQGWVEFAQNNTVSTDTVIITDIARSPRSSKSKVHIPGWRIDFVARVDHVHDPQDGAEFFQIRPDFVGGSISVQGTIHHLSVVRPYSPDPYNSMTLLYGVFKRIAQVKQIAWLWQDPDSEIGIEPFGHRLF